MANCSWRITGWQSISKGVFAGLRWRTSLSQGKPKRADSFRALRDVYSSKVNILVNLIALLVYYAIFYLGIKLSNSGIFLVTIPGYLLYSFLITSSILFTVGFHYFRTSMRKRQIMMAGTTSALGVMVGTIVASCTCSVPLVAPLLYFLGVNAVGVGFVISTIADFQTQLIIGIILADVFLIYLYLRQLSRFTGVDKAPISGEA